MPTVKHLFLPVLFATALCAQPAMATAEPQLLWGAVLRSNDKSTTRGTNSPAVVKVNASSQVFTLGAFTSHATDTCKYATYKHYDAAGNLTETATPVGALKETTGANNNLFLYKQDAQGNILWQVTSRWGDVAGAYSQIAPTADGGVLLAAKVRFTQSSDFAGDTLLQLVDSGSERHTVMREGSAQNAYQVVAAKISAAGLVQWLKPLIRVSDAKSADAIRATGLEADAAGCYYLGGRYSDTITFDKADGSEHRLVPKNAGGDLLLVKLDPNGNLLWSVAPEGSIAAQGVSSMTLHRSSLYIYGNVQGDGAASTSLLGCAIVPSALAENAYSARIDVSGATPSARWVTLLNARAQTNEKGGRVKVTGIDFDGGSVLLSGSFTGFIDKADGTPVLANDLATGTAAAQLKAFVIRQDPYTGEVLGQVKDDSSGISETYAAALRGSKVHAYGYTLNGWAWYRTYNADFTGETHHPLLSGGTAFDGVFLDSALLALGRMRGATAIPGATGGIAAEAPPAFSSYLLSFAADSLRQKNLFEQLEDAIDSVNALNPLTYTPATWTALQAAASAAQALLDGKDTPQPDDLSAALAGIRSAKGSAAVSRPEFQWGAVIRSNNTGSATPTTVTQAMSVSPDGSSVFTLNQFVTTAGGTNGAAAIYKRYDADSLRATQTAYGAVESSTTYSSKQNLLVYKLNRQGDIIWQLNSDCGQVDAAYSQITPTADGGLLLAIKACFSGEYGPNSDSTLLRLVENDGVTKHPLKWTNPITFNARHVILARIDADGHVRWIKPGITVDDRQLPGTSNTTGRAVDAIYVNGLEEDKDGNFYLAGRYVRDITLTKPDGSKITLSPRNTEGWNGDSQESRGDALLVKLDRNGDFLWNLETGGTLYYQSVGAITLANDRLFIFGNAQAPAGQTGQSYFAIQRDTIYPSDKTGAYVARLDVSAGTPALQWFTLLNARQQTNARGGYVWTHNVDYDGGELLLTGRFTGFIDNADGSNILANDYPTGTTTTQKGYIMRLNASTGKVLAAAVQGITGYYRAAFRESRVYAFGYTLGSTFYHVYSPNLAAPTGTTLFSGGMATGWDAAFFDDQLITVHRTRQAAPYINGLAEGYGLRAENAFAFSAYYTSHRMEGLQRQPVSYREALEDSLRAVKAAYPDPTPYTATSWAALTAALTAAEDTLAAAAPVAEAASNAAMAAVRAAASALITLDVGALIALLQDSIAAAKVSYPQDLYTETTWNALQQAIAGGETLLAAPAHATESMLIAAIGALAQAVDSLMTVALHDARSALIALLDTARGYEADSYIPATYASLQAAIAAAQSGVDAGNAATVAALQALGASLADAINGLVTKVDAARIALQDTISAAQAAYAQATYTEASFAALQASLAAAQDLLSDGQEHTAEQYEAAGAEIAAAISGLTTKVAAARLALQDSIEHTRATYAQASYTAATWAALQAALAAAEAALADPDASLSYLNTAAATLSAAAAALEPLPTGVARTAGSSVTVTTRQSTIVVSGAPAGATVTVVSSAGSVIHRRIATGNVQEFAVTTGLYIVTIDRKAVKTVAR